MNNNYKNEATISDYIIAFLFSCKSTRMMNRILWERVNKRHLINKNSFNKNLNRLKEKGIIGIIDKQISINRQKLNQLYKYRLIYAKPENKSKIIIIFDIPETERKTRNWLRNQIKLWGFTMIQKSVWLGNSPLPEEFQDRVKLLNIKRYIKIFNVQQKNKDI